MAFLIVQANVAHVVSDVRFMNDYVTPGEITGVNGYFCATFETATNIIMETELKRSTSEADAHEVRLTLQSRPTTPGTSPGLKKRE